MFITFHNRLPLRIRYYQYWRPLYECGVSFCEVFITFHNRLPLRTRYYQYWNTYTHTHQYRPIMVHEDVPTSTDTGAHKTLQYRPKRVLVSTDTATQKVNNDRCRYPPNVPVLYRPILAHINRSKICGYWYMKKMYQY